MLRFWNSFFFVSILIFSGGGLVNAQTVNQDIRPKNNSPLSRFGLGDFFQQNFAATAGFGGLSAAFHDIAHLNPVNPASLGHLQVTAFEVGLYSRYASVSRNNQQEGVWSGNLRYLALGLPLKNAINQSMDRKESTLGIGMSFSLQPYTLVGYDIATQETVQWGGLSTNSLKGTGGTYLLNWGNGIRYKGFSAGLNAGYLFGKITQNSRVELSEVAYDYFTEFLDETSYSGLVWNAGFQYTHAFKKPNAKGEMAPTGKRLIMGLTLGTKNNFNSNSSNFYHRDNPFFNIQDTILFVSDVKNKGALPSQWRVGVTYEEINKLRIGIEFSQSGWSNYFNDAKPERFSDTWRLSGGVEYIPEALSYNSYSRRMRYRAGFFYGTDPRSLNGEQITHKALTLGLGFPIILPRQQVSYVNFALEGGKFGISDVLDESYVQMTLGFTLNDNSWFYKRKYN